MELQRYNVIGYVRLGPGDEIWSDDPEKIKSLQALHTIENKPAEIVILEKPGKKQEAK